jgi:two-component system nitrogen regulation response regulator GlnG
VSGNDQRIEDLPLADVVRRRLRSLLDQIGSHHLPDLYTRVLEEVERVLIEEALKRGRGFRQEAARILGIHRNTLRLRMRKLGIK